MLAGALEIQLFANIARLQTDMNKANSIVGKAMGNVEKSVQLAKNALGGLGAGLLAREAVLMTDAYTKMNAQLKNSTDSQTEFNNAQEEVRRIASTAQADISTITALYQRLSLSLKETGASQKDIVDVAETVALSLKAMGASAQESSAAMLQLSQAFGSGRLAGDEFRSLTEAAPNLMRSLAASMGVPFGALKKLASEGKITADVLQKAFTDPALLASLRVQAAEMETISGAWQELKNEVMLFVGESTTASGSVSVITGAISGLAKNIDTLATGLELVAVVMATRYTASMIAAVQASYTKVAAAVALATTEQALAVIELEAAAAASAHAAAYANQARIVAASTPGFYLSATAVAELAAAEAAATATATAHTAALGRMGAATAAASASTRILSGALAIVGGTVGAGFLVAAAGAYIFVNAAKRAAEQADAVVASITDIIDNFSTMDESALTDQVAAMEKSITKTKSMLLIAENLAAETGIGAGNIRALNVQLQAETDILGLLERQLAGVKDGTRTVKTETSGLGDAAGEVAEKVAELILSMENQIKMLGMSSRAQAIFEAELKGLAAGAGPESIATIRELAASHYDLEQSLKPVTDAAQELINSLASEQAQLTMTSREQAIFNALQRAGANANAEQVAQIIASTAALFDNNAALEEQAEFQKMATDAVAEYMAAKGANQGAINQMAEELSMMRMSEKEQAIFTAMRQLDVAATNEQREAALELAVAIYDQQEAAKKGLDAWSEFSQQAARNMQDAFASFLSGTESNFGATLKRMAAEAVAADLFNRAGSFLSKSSGAGGLMGGLAEAGKFMGLFDSGGSLGAGQVGIAGEKGPELIRGPVSITSRKDTAAMMGATTNQKVSVNINVVNPKSDADGRRAGASAAREFNRAIAGAQRMI
jgi:tape measure domain-containing protein